MEENKMNILKVAGISILLFAAIQVIPYGKDHNNPKITKEVAWDSLRTKELFGRACADCHSNETKWPWYSNVAPVSWLVMSHVQEGRDHFNASQWKRKYIKKARKSTKDINKGEMPPLSYTINHPEARLSSDEKKALSRGLEKTFGY